MSGCALSAASRFAGEHVLAARGDDELLLAIDDAEVAVVVDLTDVAGVEPAVGVERFGGALGHRRGSHGRSGHPAPETSPSSARRQLDPGRARPTVPGCTRVGSHVISPGRLREPVDLGERYAEAAEELRAPRPGSAPPRDRATQRRRGRAVAAPGAASRHRPARTRPRARPGAPRRDADVGHLRHRPRAPARTPRSRSGSAASTACTVL